MLEQFHNQVVGVVLAGGLSRRMFARAGGQGDKALLDLGGHAMIEHVIDKLRPQVRCVIVNANGDPARFARLGLPVVADTIDGFVGPLAGVLAGMRWAEGLSAAPRFIATASADAPFLPADLVHRLGEAALRHPGSIAVARSGGELHPVIGLWPVALAADLEAELRRGVRKVLDWTDRYGTVAVDFDAIQVAGVSIDPFFNANTPEELDTARRLLAGQAA